MTVLAVEDLSVAFPGQDRRNAAVRGVSFSVDAGRTLGIVGESGSGKSVSLLAATGLLSGGASVHGKALHHGTDLVSLSRSRLRKLRGKEIGFVFQDPLSNLHPLLPVGRQIGEAITAHASVGRKQLRARVRELLDEVGIAQADKRIDDYPVHFSGGMRQRVMIAIAIACNPGLVIADEPTTALDVTVQASILALLTRLQRDHGTALIFVSHDLAVVSDIADEVVVMRDGEVVESGTVAAVYETPTHSYTRALLQARREIDLSPVAAVQHPPLLRVSNLEKSFTARRRRRTHQALTDVSFEIGAGEIVGLVGESGSGKSTIGRIIAGLDRPDRGNVTLHGDDYVTPGTGTQPLRPELRRSIQVVFQDPYGSLNPRRRIAETLAAPFVLAGQALRAADIRERTEKLITQVELPVEYLSRFPDQLSGGQRQRIAIARAIALAPALVVADEPVSALDVTTQAQILTLLRRLREDLGTSFLFISHDLGVVSSLCERVVVLRDGQIVEQGTTFDVFTGPRHEYTRTLVNSVPGQQRSETADV